MDWNGLTAGLKMTGSGVQFPLGIMYRSVRDNTSFHTFSVHPAVTVLGGMK